MSHDHPDLARSLAPPSAAALRAAFDAPSSLTVGVEEELMLLDPETLELAPVAAKLIAGLNGDPLLKAELPASQLEIATRACADVPEVARELATGRAALRAAANGLALPVAAAVHPFSEPEGKLTDDRRYRRTLDEFGRIARRQLIGALQVHVAVGDADSTLAVYNALRSHLPDLAALASSAPFHAGTDTGLASIRPKISDELPRQGVPPVIDSWDAFAAALDWGARADVLPEARVWWWELRPHPSWGTLELRVPDAQATLADAAGVAAVAHSLVGWLTSRHEGEDLGAPDPTWRIEENRWSACRDGVEGTMADLESGRRRPTRERLDELIGELESSARRLGCAAELAHARELVRENGAMRMRAVAADRGVRGVAAWLAGCFGDGLG